MCARVRAPKTHGKSIIWPFWNQDKHCFHIPFSKCEFYINYCSNRAKNRHERSRACHGNVQPTSQTRRFSFTFVHYRHRNTQFWNKMHSLHFTCYNQLSLRVVPVDKTNLGDSVSPAACAQNVRQQIRTFWVTVRTSLSTSPVPAFLRSSHNDLLHHYQY